MGEFFKGWRRKAGLVTLAMACVLMVAWMRSEIVSAKIGNSPEHIEFIGFTIVSGRGALLVYDPTRSEILPIHGPSGETIMVEQHLPLLAIFYLWVILPLTLLSAWLILGKRHKPHAK